MEIRHSAQRIPIPPRNHRTAVLVAGRMSTPRRSDVNAKPCARVRGIERGWSDVSVRSPSASALVYSIRGDSRHHNNHTHVSLWIAGERCLALAQLLRSAVAVTNVATWPDRGFMCVVGVAKARCCDSFVHGPLWPGYSKPAQIAPRWLISGCREFRLLVNRTRKSAGKRRRGKAKA